MNRIKRFMTLPHEATMTRMEELERMHWREPQKPSVWPVVRLYTGIGACWLLAVAGLLATVWLFGCVFASGFKFGWR